jgi:hypothetical protein
MSLQDYKFGIEIECFGSSDRALQMALREAGLRNWIVKHDGSVSGNGIEIISPPLDANSNSFSQIRKVCRILHEKRMRVDRSCGLHVHISRNAGMKVSDVATVLRRYATFESEIDNFHAPSRRGDDNEYCHSVSSFKDLNCSERRFQRYLSGRVNPINGYFLNQNEMVCNALSVEEYTRQRFTEWGIPAITNRSNAHGILALKNIMDFDRYYKVNLCSLSEHGTIEFRQHGGTTKASKIINWVKFLVGFIDKSIEINQTISAVPSSTSYNSSERPVRNTRRGRIARAALLASINSNQRRVPLNRTQIMIVDILLQNNATGFTAPQIKRNLHSHGVDISDSSLTTYLSVIKTCLNECGYSITSVTQNANFERLFKIIRSTLPGNNAQAITPIVQGQSLPQLPENDRLFSGIPVAVTRFYRARGASFETR